MSIRGSCLCGALSYEIAGALALAGHCHCSICRKMHGAPFATWAFVEPEQFRWTSDTALLGRYPSSPGRERCFCRRCGSPLVASHDGKVTEIVLASVDGDPGVRPSEHVFVASRACWDEITDALPQHDELPPGVTA